MKTMTTKVWTGKKTIKVTGKLLPFVEPERTQPAIDNYKDVQLFNAGRKWWLFYGFHLKSNGKPDRTLIPRLTGNFKSRKEAAHWFNHGGR